MVFALLNVITVCPMLAHQAIPSQSCCEHSHGQNLPCTDTTPNNCPYVLLEKSQAKFGAAADLLPTVSANQPEALHPGDWFSSPTVRYRRTDASGSYLLIRVLLI
jgi:hypothetical protein